MAPLLSTALVEESCKNTLKTYISKFISVGWADNQNRTREGYYERILKFWATNILSYGFYFKQPWERRHLRQRRNKGTERHLCLPSPCSAGSVLCAQTTVQKLPWKFKIIIWPPSGKRNCWILSYDLNSTVQTS